MNEGIHKLEMRFRIVSAVIAVLFLLSLQMVPCSAFYVPLSIEEMTEAADVILIGTIEDVLHVRTHREVTVSVEIYLKNPLETDMVTVVALGATVGNVTYVAEEQPEFQESERVLLFLRDDPWFLDDNPQGFYQVVSGDQGKFTVGSDDAISDSGLVIEDGFRVGEIEFKLSERSTFRNLVVPVAIALLGLGVIVFLYYRSRVST
jgi:hypothetical protein